MDELPQAWMNTQDISAYDSARYVIYHASNPLLVLRGFAELHPQIEALEFAAVRDCRAMGYSWEKIAEAMLRQRQAVWKQYAPLLNESATEIAPEDEPA